MSMASPLLSSWSMQSGRPASILSVALVSDSAETLDGLERYLREAGFTARGTRSLDQICEMISPLRSVVILFPDEFPAAEVLAALALLKRRRPGARPVLVTKDFRRFATVEGVVVIPKPIWGMTILEAVRSHLERVE